MTIELWTNCGAPSCWCSDPALAFKGLGCEARKRSAKLKEIKMPSYRVFISRGTVLTPKAKRELIADHAWLDEPCTDVPRFGETVEDSSHISAAKVVSSGFHCHAVRDFLSPVFRDDAEASTDALCAAADKLRMKSSRPKCVLIRLPQCSGSASRAADAVSCPSVRLIQWTAMIRLYLMLTLSLAYTATFSRLLAAWGNRIEAPPNVEGALPFPWTEAA